MVGAAVAIAAGAAAAVRATAVPRAAPISVRDGAALVVDRDALDRVNLELVHTELVPDWTAASGGVRGLHLERLRRAVAPDPNLLALLDRVAELETDPVPNGPELRALLRAWNEYVSRGGAPWRLGGEVVLGDDGARYLVKTYRAITDEPTARVGDAAFRVEVRRRVDALGASDAWLGRMHDHQEGVVLLLDRLTSFALDEVWPTLDPELPLTPLQSTFAPAIRAELARHLAPAELGALEQTAADRFYLMRAVGGIHARHACGSTFTVSKLAWSGFAARDLATFQRHTGPLDGPCPEVLPEEALTLATRSWHVRRTAGVREALERLVAVVARGVSIHEARHAADDRLLSGQRIACIGCPEGTSHLGALEASAYVAAFADPAHSVLSLFQACRAAEEASEDVREAVAFVAGRVVDGGCAAPPPSDLAARAAALEAEVFLRSDRMELAAFPDGLPVSSEYRGR